MTEQSIIDNAPSPDWTHFDDYDYYKLTASSALFRHIYRWDCIAGDWLFANLPRLTRSRTDIERIAQLTKEKRDLIAFYHDAMHWFNKHDPNAYISPKQEKSRQLLIKRDLEQQSQGIANFLISADGSPREFDNVSELVIEGVNRVKQLRQKAQEVKGD